MKTYDHEYIMALLHPLNEKGFDIYLVEDSYFSDRQVSKRTSLPFWENYKPHPVVGFTNTQKVKFEIIFVQYEYRVVCYCSALWVRTQSCENLVSQISCLTNRQHPCSSSSPNSST